MPSARGVVQTVVADRQTDRQCRQTVQAVEELRDGSNATLTWSFSQRRHLTGRAIQNGPVDGGITHLCNCYIRLGIAARLQCSIVWASYIIMSESFGGRCAHLQMELSTVSRAPLVVSQRWS